jgi:hypothetical protein
MLVVVGVAAFLVVDGVVSSFCPMVVRVCGHGKEATAGWSVSRGYD